jgi:hypothetical protein
MLIEKTVFILGAGSSKEVGLPIGTELVEQIARDVNVVYNDFDTRITSGALPIFQAYRQNRDARKYFACGRRIAQAASLITSIDRFIDHNPNDPIISKCGKLGIAHAILEAESKSKLNPNQDDPSKPAIMEAIKNTWFIRLFNLLKERIDVNNLPALFNNVSFINFNYDRCLEHFLFNSIINYYQSSETVAANLVKEANIFHPYGVLGPLPWQADICALPFGFDRVNGQTLIEVAGRIRTFTEQLDDGRTVEAIRAEIASAETVVFLGFSFLLDNLALITPTGDRKVRRVIATSLGIPPAHVKGHSDRVTKAVAGSSCQPPQFFPVRCADLFDEVDFSVSI